MGGCGEVGWLIGIGLLFFLRVLGSGFFVRIDQKVKKVYSNIGNEMFRVCWSIIKTRNLSIH